MLAVDFGEARIGLAVSDPSGTLCSPLETLRARDDSDDLATIASIAEREGAVRIVVGLPMNMDGTRGPAARRVTALCAGLRKVTAIPVTTWDERLTSFEAENRLRAAGRSPSRNKASIDSAAAAIILEGYLASIRGSQPIGEEPE